MSERVDILALGAACIVPALGLLWKAASLRKDVFDKWAVRADIVSAGLSEQAARILRRLQVATDELLGDPTEGFNPDLAVSDPGALQRLTREFDRMLSTRRKIRRRFRLILKTCVAAPCLVIAYLVGAATALTFYAGVHTARWVGWTGLGLAAASIIAGTIVTIAYWYLNGRLTTAEILAYIPSDSSEEETPSD